MTPGPKIIRECSACGNLISQYTLGSGNTFRARFWTDGKMEAPMLPDLLWLIKCRHCGTLVWIDEQTQVAEINGWAFETDDMNTFPDSRSGSIPTLQDYADFLDAGVSDTGKERYVRLRVWWAGNDARRKSDQSTPLSSFETQNLTALLTLLDETEDNDRIMKAEVLRELGEFDEVENLLNTEFDDKLTQTVSIIRDLNQKRISTVAEIRLA